MIKKGDTIKYKKEIMFGAVAVVLFLLIAVYLIHINKNNINEIAFEWVFKFNDRK